MTRNARALLLALAMMSPFVALQPHANAEQHDFVRDVVCAPQYAWDCATAQSIVWRESSNQHNAINPSSLCAGWWQIHPIHGHSIESLMDPYFNTHVAYQLWLERGWQPWMP